MILAIICSSLISVIMRISQEKRKSDMGMFIFNYAVCSLLGLLFIPKQSFSFSEKGIVFTVLLGLVGGILFLLSFLLFQQGIKKNGMMLASVFMKLGVIIPVLMSVIFFREVPKPLQIAGTALSVAAIILFNYDKSGTGGKKSIVLLILLLAASGFADSMVNVYDKLGSSKLSDVFLLLIFFFAGIFAAVLYFVRKEKMCGWDVLFGALIGIPNYFSSRFLMMSLQSVPAVAAYPIYSVATIVVISAVGIIAFHETVSKKKIIGLVLVIAAVAALA